MTTGHTDRDSPIVPVQSGDWRHRAATSIRANAGARPGREFRRSVPKRPPSEWSRPTHPRAVSREIILQLQAVWDYWAEGETCIRRLPTAGEIRKRTTTTHPPRRRLDRAA